MSTDLRTQITAALAVCTGGDLTATCIYGWSWLAGNFKTVGVCNLSQPIGAGFGGAPLRCPVHDELKQSQAVWRDPEGLRIAGEACPFALRAVGRDEDQVPPLTPADILLQEVDAFVRAGEAARSPQVATPCT